MSRDPSVLVAGPRLAAKAREERAERRRTWWRRSGIGVAVAAVLVALGWVVLASPVLALHDVKVSGGSRLSEERIAAAVTGEVGTPLARVDTAGVARRIRALGPVASVTVSREWPRSLRVTVVERVPVVAVPRGGQLQLLDAEGEEVARVARLPRGVYRLDTASTEATEAALTVLRGLPSSLTSRLGSLRAPSPELVTLVLRHGRRVQWGGTGDAQLKASTALALLKLPGTVYDVSAPGVATRR